MAKTKLKDERVDRGAIPAGFEEKGGSKVPLWQAEPGEAKTVRLTKIETSNNKMTKKLQPFYILTEISSKKVFGLFGCYVLDQRLMDMDENGKMDLSEKALNDNDNLGKEIYLQYLGKGVTEGGQAFNDWVVAIKK